jgi:HD-GYP domain-containing protein (c-di-GMP phosphodiesterase class II)
MIDWFPLRTRHLESSTPADDLARWRGMVNLRRVAGAIDERDVATVGHSERVAEIAARIAREVGWLTRRTRQIHEVALIHDVGKICVPDEILLSPGPLAPDDYEVVKAHATVGAQVASTVCLPRQVAWVRHHHERWDGRGYPDGLAGEEIPEGAAILCVADAWDAMTHRSWTGEALDRDEALEECRREAGSQFAPWAVAALEAALERVAVLDLVPVAIPLRLVPA